MNRNLTPDSDRRTFLTRVGGTAAAAVVSQIGFDTPLHAAVREKLPVAAVVTVYNPNSHADVIVGKILEGWRQDGGEGPDLKLVSLYVDQFGSKDLSRGLSERLGFKMARTIDEAITLGTDRVQVAGVLSIGEHGDYPDLPETGQKMYPRRRFFEQIVAAFDRCGTVVPVFNDKHLSYRFTDAKYMCDTAQQKGFPLLAGSSVPVTIREPAVEIDRDDELMDAVTIGYGGLEAYGFHALEAHQAMIERRRDGESGVVAVQALQGEAIYQAAAEKRWSVDLFESALATLPGRPSPNRDWTTRKEAALFLLDHQDGLKTAVVMTASLAPEFAFAGKVKGLTAPVSTWIRLQDNRPYSHFAHLLRAIDETFHTQKAVYPVERTLLTTGILDRLMHSLAQNGKRFETPELLVPYQPTDWAFANHSRSALQLNY